VNLTETGQSRVNGYLFVLERSLKTFLPIEVVRDAVREISHLRERIAASDGSPNEREALERILLELGPPLHVARAYSAERIVDEAIATERVVPMLRAPHNHRRPLSTNVAFSPASLATKGGAGRAGP
jgi:hypothetical protein